jgi:hypothetical protein
MTASSCSSGRRELISLKTTHSKRKVLSLRPLRFREAVSGFIPGQTGIEKEEGEGAKANLIWQRCNSAMYL